MDYATEQLKFNAWIPIEKAGPDENGQRIVSGPVASSKVDFDGDILNQSGVWKALDEFFKLGAVVDWCHLFSKSPDPDVIIGKAIGKTLIQGIPWLATQLRTEPSSTPGKEPLWDKAWNYITSPLGMKCGYSIEGSGVRSSGPVPVTTPTRIIRVTIAPQPKGYDQFIQAGLPPAGLVEVAKAIVGASSADTILSEWEPVSTDFAKALTTGGGIVENGDTGGEALREQFLVGGNRPSRKRKRRSRKMSELAKVLIERGASIEQAEEISEYISQEY